MAQRQCPNCKSPNVKVVPFSELTTYHMGHLRNPWLALAKLAVNYTVYPWLQCQVCRRMWRQWEPPF